MGQIIVNLDVEMAKRKMSLSELAGRVGLTLANLSILKTGKAKAVRFTTLEAICRELNCQPGDILEYRDEELFQLSQVMKLLKLKKLEKLSHMFCSELDGFHLTTYLHIELLT